MEHAVVMCRGEKITPRDLPGWVRSGENSAPGETPLAGKDLTVKQAEKELIIRALHDTGGSRTLAAKKLGMSRRTLHRKLNEYQIE